MYISRRSAIFKNASISTVNGCITLAILLIAPLGLTAVIMNTLLMTFSTYIVSSVADRIVLWLEPEQRAELGSLENGENPSPRSSKIRRW